eukprot:s2086_g13.t1
MECALHAAEQHPEWPRSVSSAPDMPVASLLFMDDSILWDSSRTQLATKFRLFSDALREWGLTVNTRKTTLYCSPYATEVGDINLGMVKVQQSQTMEVMGVQLSVPLKPAAIMDTGMSKARKKYFASRHVLECRGPLKKRLRVFQATVGGAALWYASAAMPTAQAMGALNTMQLELVARMSGLKRQPEEAWLDFRLRSMRAARQILVNLGLERWSTQWLRRHWQYRGHVTRAALRESPPASSRIDAYRTLKWWRESQRWKDGPKHPRSFFPHLSNEETRLNRAAGVDNWRDLALKLAEWKMREAAWVEMNDVAWCSGRQLALPVPG